MTDNQKKCKSTKPTNEKNKKNDDTTKNNRASKLETIGLDPKSSIDEINDALLDKIYNGLIKKQQNEQLMNGQSVSKPKNDKVKKEDPRYVLTLEVLNAILNKLHKPIIENISEFKDVNRDDLLKEECDLVMCTYYKKIMDLFKKYEVNDFYKVHGKNYVINIIRSLTINCGYYFVGKTRETKKMYNSGAHKRVYNRYYFIL